MTVRARNPEPEPELSWGIVTLIGVIAGITLRFVLRGKTSLWEDEIIAATHAMQPWRRLITNVIMNDVHPPFYFLELHLWSFLGTSDGWLIANSILFSLLAVASIYAVVKRLGRKQSAPIAAAIMAALPAAIWMAQEVRMYAMLSVLFIWMLYFTHRTYAERQLSVHRSIGVLLLGGLIAYTHAIGFIAVFFYALYAASLLFAYPSTRRHWHSWLIVFGLLGLATIPLLLGGLIHKADMPPVTGLQDIVGWAGSAIAGEGYKTVPWLCIAGAVIYLMVALLGLCRAETRRLTICFLLLPLLLCAAVGLTVKPVFKTNFFSTFFSPFIAIILASAFTAPSMRALTRTLLLIVTLTALMSMAAANRLALDTANGYYRHVVDTIEKEKQPGDAIWAPQMSIFWGVAWYMAGPHWGSPVTVNDPFREGSGWWKLFDRMGPDLVHKLDLLPKQQVITAKDAVPLYIGFKSESLTTLSRRVWLVTYAPRNDVPAGMPGDSLGPMHRVQSFDYAPIQLNLYVHNEEAPNP